MRRLLIILTSLLTLAASSYGQAVYTTVTATLVDSSSQVWAGATVIASLRPSPNNPAVPLNNGTVISDSPQTTIADNTGTFTLILDRTSSITPAGALWTFNIYPNASVKNSSSINLAITGTTLNLSGILSSILIVPSVSANPVINRAYTNSEVIGGTGAIYWDVTANALKGCATVVAGLCTAWSTIGNFSVPGSHFYIPYNNGSGAFTANINLQFNDITNTLSTFNIIISGDISANDALFSGSVGVTGSGSFGLGINTNTGFTINNLAPLNHILTGDGNNYKDSTSWTNPVLNGTPTGTAIQGTDTKLMSSGTISGTLAALLCLDALGGATTTNCNNVGGIPSLTAGTGAGTGPILTLLPNSTDKLGAIQVTTGTAPSANQAIVNLVYSVTYTTDGFCTFTPASPITAALNGTSAVSGFLPEKTQLTLQAGTVALAASTTYRWSYLCNGY